LLKKKSHIIFERSAHEVSVVVTHWTRDRKIWEFDAHLQLTFFLCTYMCINMSLPSVYVAGFLTKKK